MRGTALSSEENARLWLALMKFSVTQNNLSSFTWK